MKKSSLFTSFAMYIALAVSVFAQPYLAVNDANHDYLTLNYYIDEDEGTSETLHIEFWPNEGNVEQAQLWSNLGRRDYATLGDQDALSVPGPSPAGTNYFVGIPLNSAGGGKWEAHLPIDKTGAYRLTGRYKVSGDPDWRWVGGRDTAIMVSPNKARDVVLYELQVNVINATGDTEGTRSTFEDLMDPTKPANLDYFENLGVNTLWIQPIHPIGNHTCIDKAQGPGSPYSIQNMWEVAPHMSYGNTREAAMAAFTNFAVAAGAKGIDFFFDIIFNHTSWDAEIGRDPDNPTQPASNPTALIRDILPQWYSRYVGSFPGDYCNASRPNWEPYQGNFHFTLPARNAGEIGPAPAERIDFGKWPDVADLFWGDYPALSDVGTDSDTWWNMEVAGADVRRMTEYFAHFGVYWIEKSGGALGGFRCDYAQGLPPQAWEYIVNKTRQVKWDFIFMAESLDGGNVSKRAGRHMDIINQNWVWQVGGDFPPQDTTALRGAVDGNKTDYGFAGIMRGIINHDQNAPANRWFSLSRYALGAVIDGAPQMYQGQELGYENGFGFSRFRIEHGRAIPDIFKWHNMQPLWNNRDGVLEEAYKRVNRARIRSEVTRLHDQWYLDQVSGFGPHQRIFSVLKYDRFGWDPAHQNVVLSFVNLEPWTGHLGTFDLSSVQAVYINPTRTYNVRNLMADDDQAYLWGAGRTGQDILDNGVHVVFSSSPLADPATATVQVLVLEEHGGNQPFEPWVSWDPEVPEGCDPVTIRYRKADSPLGAGPVYIHIGRNGWQDAIDPNPQMANDGDYWVYYHSVLPGTEVLDFAFNDGNADPEARIWDSNSGDDWHVTVTGCIGPISPVVWTDPEEPEGCDPITIYYDASTRILAAANPVYIHIGRNGWQGVIDPNPAMTSEGDGVWSYVYEPEPGTEVMNFAFNNGGATWDNNGGSDWNVTVTGCEGVPPPPYGFVITNPASSIAVGNAVASYTLHGIADDMEGTLDWTNALTGATGSIPHANPWTIADIALGVGGNVITLNGMTTGASGEPEVIAQDQATNYSGGWADGVNHGTGFGPWALSDEGADSGHFVWTSAEYGHADIDTDALSFGMYGNANQWANSERGITAWEDGYTFSIDLAVQWRDGNRGISLFNSTTVFDEVTEIWNLNISNDGYGATGFGYRADMVLNIAVTQNGANLDIVVTGSSASEAWSDTWGTTVTGEVLGGFRLYIGGHSSGSDGQRNLYFNNLVVTEPGTGEPELLTRSVTITRLEGEGQDSNGDGVPDSFYIQYGLDHTDPNVGQTPAPNGYTYKASYVMQLNPNDAGMTPFRMQVNVDGSFTFEAPAGGRRYLLEYTTNLMTQFQTVGEVPIGQAIAPNGSDDHGYYRIRFLGMN